MVASGVMKLVGTIIVHSILQGGPGFPVFSSAAYNYLVTGDLHEAIKGIILKDCSIQMEHFISKVREKFKTMKCLETMLMKSYFEEIIEFRALDKLRLM